MYLSIILLLCHLSRSLSQDTIIQIQHLGEEEGGDRVLLNGVSLTSTSQEVDLIIRSLSVAAPPPTPTDVNQTATWMYVVGAWFQGPSLIGEGAFLILVLLVHSNIFLSAAEEAAGGDGTFKLENHTVLRLRECILEGSQVHWTDRVLYDGTVYLSLDQTDTWTAQAPQAHALKAAWDQDVARTRKERVHLQEGCVKLIKELRLSADQQPVPVIPVSAVLVPVLSFLALTGLIMIGLLISNQGLRHPGGVIGSIIHYPQDITEMPPERRDCGYQAL